MEGNLYIILMNFLIIEAGTIVYNIYINYFNYNIRWEEIRMFWVVVTNYYNIKSGICTRINPNP